MATAFQAAVGDRPDQLTSLVFLNLNQLLRLGQRSGLINSGRATMLWPALEGIRAAGLASWRGDSDTTIELQSQIP
jgi:hypothetical protein